MKKLVFALLLTYPTAAAAESACENPRDDFDGLYCLNKLYQEADRELNENYGKLTGKLNSEGKSILKNTQLSWIEERNSNCSRREEGKFFVNLSCATDMTIRRTHFLQDRYRECVSAGCQNSKL